MILREPNTALIAEHNDINENHCIHVGELWPTVWHQNHSAKNEKFSSHFRQGDESKEKKIKHKN